MEHFLFPFEFTITYDNTYKKGSSFTAQTLLYVLQIDTTKLISLA